MPLPERWTPILEKGKYPLRGERLRYYQSTARFQIAAGGRRSLKTELAKRKIVEKFLSDAFTNHHGYFDTRYIYSGPTRDQMERIAWSDIQKLIPPKYIKRVWESDLCIEHIYGPELWVMGLDRPSRVEGNPLDGIVIDEFADIPEGAWEANIRPALSDRQGWAILIGVPDFAKPNNTKFQELFELGLSGKNPEYESFTWASKEVLPDAEVESAARDLDAVIFKQEYEASFETAPGRAYSSFSRTAHITEINTDYDPSLPLLVSCDFNIEHHNWGIYQNDRLGDWVGVDEVYLRGDEVEFMVKELKEKLDRFLKIKDGRTYQDLNLVFYGDFSGNNRSATATHTAWQQIKNGFGEKRNGLLYTSAEFAYAKQPPVSDRINAVNAVLRNAAGETHTRINPRCKNLIRDFEKVTRKMLFSQIKGDKLTHMSDNFGYAVCQHKTQTSRRDLIQQFKKRYN
jgi:hypothetical protein